MRMGMDGILPLILLEFDTQWNGAVGAEEGISIKKEYGKGVVTNVLEPNNIIPVIVYFLWVLSRHVHRNGYGKPAGKHIRHRHR
jgi:hypothetical protein